jgi:hypothetical protein
LHTFNGVNYFNVLASKDLRGGLTSSGNNHTVLIVICFLKNSNFYKSKTFIDLVLVLHAKRLQQPSLTEDLIEWTLELYNEFKVSLSLSCNLTELNLFDTNPIVSRNEMIR